MEGRDVEARGGGVLEECGESEVGGDICWAMVGRVVGGVWEV